MHPELATVDALADEIQVAVARMSDPNHAVVPVDQRTERLANFGCKQFTKSVDVWVTTLNNREKTKS